jgi:hypothetical protein
LDINEGRQPLTNLAPLLVNALAEIVSGLSPLTPLRLFSEKVGAAASVSIRSAFGGLANQVAAEEEKDTAGTWKTSKSCAYGAFGENLPWPTPRSTPVH